MDHLTLGRATEARFILEATNRGWLVSKPVTEAPGYDCIVDTGVSRIRVQVKGRRLTRRHQGRSAVYNVTLSRFPTRRPQFDVLAVYTVDDGSWLFWPAKRLGTVSGFDLGKRGTYRDAARDWSIFK